MNIPVPWILWIKVWVLQRYQTYTLFLSFVYSKGIKKGHKTVANIKVSKFHVVSHLFVAKCMTTRPSTKKRWTKIQSAIQKRTFSPSLPFPPPKQKKPPNSADLIFSVKGLEDLWLELRPRCQVGVSQEATGFTRSTLAGSDGGKG